MPSVQDIPDDVPASLADQLPPVARLQFRLFGDITLDGRYGVCVLAADDERIYYASVEEGETDGQVRHVLLRDINDVEMKSYVGGGALRVDREHDSIEVARFSQSRVEAFESVAGQLAEMTRQASDDVDDEESLIAMSRRSRKNRRCPECGRALSARAEVCLHCVDKRQLVFRIVSLLSPYKKVVAVGLFATLAATVLGLVPPTLTRWLIDKAIIPGDLALFWIFLAIFLGCYIVMALFQALRTYVLGWLGQTVIYDLRMRAFNRLQELSLNYYDSHQTGRLISRVTNDCERIERFVVEVMQQLIVDVLTLALILGILLASSWKITLATLIPVPAVFVMVWVFSRKVKSTYRKAWRTSASLTAHLADIIPGVRVVKGFAREQEEQSHFEERAQRLIGHMLRVFKLRASVFPMINFVSRLGFLMLWLVGGYMALQEFANNPDLVNHAREEGTLLSVVVMFSMLLWRLYEPIGRLSRVTDQLQRAATSAERVFELLDAMPEVSEPKNPATLGGRSSGHVAFQGITFAYDPNAPVLRKVSLDVQPGEMIGIVGHSGVGKSTLASLLLRFYDPDEGSVLLDGVDIRKLAGRELRSNIGLVLQEPTLFHGSVLENIRYGKRDATYEEVIAAAKVANAHNFLVKLPEGYDTQVGERGVRLSQGEKQRISIARAILRDPPILILDEATASVDTETERLIQSALDRLVEGRTVLAIAHRLSTLRNADRIIVLDNGHIAESGNHEQLLAEQGIYYDLCQAQSMLVTRSPVARKAEPAPAIGENGIDEIEGEEFERDDY